MYKTPELAEIGTIAEVVLGFNMIGNDNDTLLMLPSEGLVLGLDE
jgi:hypothetical protein